MFLVLRLCFFVLHPHTHSQIHTPTHTLRVEDDRARSGQITVFPFWVSSHFARRENFFFFFSFAFLQFILFSRLSVNFTSGFQHLLTTASHTYHRVNGDQMASTPSSSSSTRPAGAHPAPRCQSYTSERKRY